MTHSLDDEVGKGANDSNSWDNFQDSYMNDYENCRIPYQNNISDKQQEDIRLRIETWLFKNGILSSDRIKEIHKQHLSKNEWEMINETPERYWPELFVTRMNQDEINKIDKGPYIKNVYEQEESRKRYFVSTTVWTAVAEKIYFDCHGKLPSIEEESEIINNYSGPTHRCFFVLAENAADLRVVYDWASNFLRDWRQFRERYEQEHREIEHYSPAA